MNIKSNAGFSLVELMVVVAIIGVLATVAVPNYMKFQAKAKQTSAKTELAGVYTAQKAFLVEYNTYHGSLPLIGYVPEGYSVNVANCPTTAAATRMYTVGFAALAAVPLGTFPIDNCTTVVFNYAAADYGATGTAVTAANGVNTAVPATSGTTFGILTAAGAAIAAGAVGVKFTAAAWGAPSRSSVRSDVWTMTDLNVLQNTSSGI